MSLNGPSNRPASKLSIPATLSIPSKTPSTCTPRCKGLPSAGGSSELNPCTGSRRPSKIELDPPGCSRIYLGPSSRAEPNPSSFLYLLDCRIPLKFFSFDFLNFFLDYYSRLIFSDFQTFCLCIFPIIQNLP